MTKKEIANSIAAEMGLTQYQAGEAVQRVLNGVIDALLNEGRIELRNFGVFELRKRKARKARNPRTGEIVDVPEKFVIGFKPGRTIEERVGRLSSPLARRALVAVSSDASH
jgi:nucleoid DNA-binding protein